MTVELVLLSRVSVRGQEITGPRLRGLLALLAADLRAGCGTGRLVEGLWPDGRPESPTKALQVLVSRARAQWGSDVIASTPTGYRLALSEDQVDAAAVLLRAAASARHSRAGDHAAALGQAEAGLAWWDGAPSPDPDPADPVSELRAARVSTYRSLVRSRALGLSRLGRRAEAIEPLAELTAQAPQDEEVLAELLGCEAAIRGPATALTRYDAYRRGLRAELGADPGAALQRVHQRLLRGDQPVVRRGVAYEPNPLLGRDGDIAAVTDLLRRSRVTSIVGAGGLGKTRLAQVVSRQAEQRVVHFVALAGVTADGDVMGEVASALGVGDTGSPDVLAGIVNALGAGPALLVLDNCEHLIRGAAEVIGALVSMSADLRVLTTSRAPLGLSSESVYPLPELSLLTTVELFTQRARAARPDVDLPAAGVEALCGRLDGLPLAVELAAARVRVSSVAEIARRLDDRLALLRGGARDAPQRHRTLHAVIDWSWRLLEPAGQAAMRALSIFPGGFTADAARHLLGDDESLEPLVDQSLLKVAETGAGTRFRMLETVREFSTAERERAGETESVTGRFLAWARDLGMAHHESIFGADLVRSVALVRVEQDNLAQALRLALDRADGATVAATSAVLGGLWTVESNFTRLATLAGEPAWVLSHFRPGPALVEAVRTASVLAAFSVFLLARPRAARPLLTLRRLPPAAPDSVVRAAAVVLRAVTETAEPTALHELCESDQPLLAGTANYVVSHVLEHSEDLDGALKAATQMLTAVEQQKNPWFEAVAHGRIAEVCLEADRDDEAQRHARALLPLLAELEARTTAARIRWAIVLANLRRGAIDESERWLEQTVRWGSDEATGLPAIELAVRAEIRMARGDVEGGRRLWRHAADQVRSGSLGSDHPLHQAWVAEIQAVTVVAHARAGRLDQVEEITGDLPSLLSRLLTSLGTGSTTVTFVGPAVCGAVLLALAMVDLDRGRRTRDARATWSAVRMVALAERLRFARNFQPTMSAAHARRAAERADASAYADAVAAYAGLGRDALPAAALAVLRVRDSADGVPLEQRPGPEISGQR